MVGEEDAGELRSNAEICERMMQALQDVGWNRATEDVLTAIDRGVFAGGGSGRHWTLDPIDGTKGFLRGDQYAIALALIEDGEVVLGILGCPNLSQNTSDPDKKGVIFVAVKGEGCTMYDLEGLNLGSVSVATVDDISAAKFCESVEAAHSSHSDSAKIAERLKITAAPYRIDSQCKYAAVARGDAAIYLRLPTRPGLSLIHI